MEVHAIKKEQGEEEEYFKKLHIHPRQDEFINDLAIIICSTIPYNYHAIRGSIFRACRKWQLKNRKSFSSVMGLGKLETFKFWIQFSSLIIELTKHSIKGENEMVFESMLGEGFTLYQAQFCHD